MHVTKVEIFTGPRCVYCEQAKALLRQQDIAYEELDIGEPEQFAQFIDRLPRMKSLPQIFVNGEHIGGLEDLQIISEDGRLGKLLNENAA